MARGGYRHRVRVFVTGGSGFVGTWLKRHLQAHGDDVFDDMVDITDAAALRSAVHHVQPDAVYHLAGLANVGESWTDPAAAFTVNATGTLHLLEAVRALADVPRVLVVCSAEVYGTVRPDELPLREDAPLRPASPYAASKVGAEFLALQAFLGYGTPTIRVRAFNHIGPGQGEGFVVSALAKRIAEAERDGQHEIVVGNVTTRRDFTDVRDVVRAYRLLIERGDPGAVYNVCSGVDQSIDGIARRLLQLSTAELSLVVDPHEQRKVDVPVLRGDAHALRVATGWGPEIELDVTLREVLEFWRERVRVSVP